MTGGPSGERTPEEGWSAMAEQRLVAKTYSTAAARDSNLGYCWDLRKRGGAGAGRAGVKP